MRLPDTLVTSIVDVIIMKMTGNADFPTPSPTLTVVGAANTAAKDAIANASGAGPAKTAIKDARMADLADVVRALAAYVTVTSAGDMAKLLRSGFPTQNAPREPIGQLPTPDTPRVSPNGLYGKIDAATSPVPGAYIYNWKVTTAASPATVAADLQTTAASASFAGLTRGTIYNVQVNAVGTAGTTEWSDAANITAP